VLSKSIGAGRAPGLRLEQKMARKPIALVMSQDMVAMRARQMIELAAHVGLSNSCNLRARPKTDVVDAQQPSCVTSIACLTWAAA